MSSARRPRSNSSNSTPVEIVGAPKDNSEIDVCFLGPWEEIHEHFNGKRPVPCAGEPECEARVHRMSTSWRGFCPARWWEQDRCIWIPCVFEVTEFLQQFLSGRILRGETWRVQRKILRGEKAKVYGELVDSCTEDECEDTFDVRPIVENAFHTKRIKWGLKPIFEPVLMLPVSRAAPPPGRRGAPITREEKAAAEEAQRIEAAAVLKKARDEGRI